MGGPFSLRCLSPLCSPAAGVGQTQTAVLEMLRCGWDGFAAQNSRLGFCSTVGINNHAQTTQLDALMQLGYFRNTKGQRDFISTLAFIASHEARRRMAVFSIQLARSHTRPASREARCRAAVTPQPSCFPTSTPAPYGRGVGCRGTAPARPQRAVRGAGLSPAGGRP